MTASRVYIFAVWSSLYGPHAYRGDRVDRDHVLLGTTLVNSHHYLYQLRKPSGKS